MGILGGGGVGGEGGPNLSKRSQIEQLIFLLTIAFSSVRLILRIGNGLCLFWKFMNRRQGKG